MNPTTRQGRADAQSRKLAMNQDRYRAVVDFVYPIIVGALEAHEYNDDLDYLVPSKWDIKKTGAELRAEFGPLGRDLIELLFIRWQVKTNTIKGGARDPRWRLNLAFISVFNEWHAQNGKTATLRAALDYLKSQNIEPYRRIRNVNGIEGVQVSKGIVLSKSEYLAQIDKIRDKRRAWGLQSFRYSTDEDKQILEALH